MKFFEAVEIARKTGKSIQANGGGVAYWDGLYLRWEPRETRHNVLLSSYNLDDDWKVIEPPPKEYDFAEACRMMKAGKWMKAVNTDVMYSFFRGRLEYRIGKDSCISLADAIDINAIDSKWIEVLQ